MGEEVGFRGRQPKAGVSAVEAKIKKPADGTNITPGSCLVFKAKWTQHCSTKRTRSVK